MSRKIKYSGELDLAGTKMPCYVLEDGTRVLSGRAMQGVLKMGSPGDEGKPEEQKSGVELSRFIASKWFNDLISNEKELEHFQPIVCFKGNQKINGFEATALVDFCNTILQARKDGKITSVRRRVIADQCEILIRSFAKIGIIALIDEATGYQYDREKLELQAILKLFISEEILDWQRTFHLGFYKEIFRLWGIPFTPDTIKRKPPFVGGLTNELVYKNLPKGSFVLNKLKEKTPRTEGGNYKVRLHQSLTDIGKEELKKVLYSVESLAAISETKPKFLRLVADRYGQRTFPFPDFDKLETKKVVEKPTSFDNVLKGMLNVPTPPKEDDKGDSPSSKNKD